MDQKIMDLLVDKDESIVAVIGQNYLESGINGEMSKSVMVLSSKRLYQKGKIYDNSDKGKWQSLEGQKIVDVNDITGTSFVESKAIWVIIVALIVIPIATLIGISTMVTGLPSKQQADVFVDYGPSGISYIVGLLLIIIPIITFLIIYKITQKKLFVVEFAGGAIGSKANWYSRSELNEFQKHIALLQDRVQ